MIPVPENSFLIDVSAGAESVLALLQDKFRIEETAEIEGEETFYDTFDWRLYRQKMICAVNRNQLVLRSFDGQEICRLAGRRKRQIFWWDLEASELSTVLRKELSMRALCPTLSFKYARRSFKIVNRDCKTIARCMLQANVAVQGRKEMELPVQLYVQAIRGYEKAYRKVIGALSGQLLSPLGQYVDLLQEAYGVSERQPLDYGAKFGVELDHGINIGQAVSTICCNLVDTMEINLPGVMDDIDSEFLHDFRIAVRRTRSLVSLLRKVLPVEQISRFESEFKWLGSVTGPLRDIDVYLLKKNEYRNMLPGSLAEGLDLFFVELQERRADELILLKQNLASGRYSDLVESWRRFNSDPTSDLFSGVREESCRDLVNSIIRKRFRSFLRDADQISDDTPDQDLHRLRIKGKKFRYLLEFFRTFYDLSEVDLFLKHMKKLQDNLGDFNDLSVQMELLEAKLGGLKGRNRQTLQLAASLGSLITKLSEEHLDTRKKFNKIYKTFSTPDNKRLITVMTTDSDAKSSSKRKV